MVGNILIKNGTIVTLGKNNKIYRDHGILVNDGKIEKIAPLKELEKAKVAKTIDAHGKVVMPGFINTHMHFYSTFVRGFGNVKPSKDFNEVLQNLWWKLDRELTLEDVYYSTLIACIDGIKHGTTTYIDHHASPCAITGSLGKIADAIEQLHLKASLCYELSDRDGKEIAEEGIRENIDFMEQLKNNPRPSIRSLFGLHASFTISDETLQKASELAKAYNGGFHIHTAEAVSDQEDCFVKHGMRVVERLEKYEILGPNTICAHCTNINEKEMDILKETRTNVVHNPQSNMNNAVGVADVLTMVDKGILVGLGTDAMTTNMLEEVRSALWIQKLRNNNPGVGFMECVNLLLSNNATICNNYWDTKIGELKEGYSADIILIDYESPTEFSENTILGHVVFGLSQSKVDTTITNGHVVMENKELVNIDEAEIAKEARKVASELWRRL